MAMPADTKVPSIVANPAASDHIRLPTDVHRGASKFPWKQANYDLLTRVINDSRFSEEARERAMRMRGKL